MTPILRRTARIPGVPIALPIALWALALVVTSAVACGGEGDEKAEVELRVVSQPEAVAMLESDNPPLFLDVRTPEEYAKGHVPGAVLIPHTEIEERMDEVLGQRERLIVVYCERGGRAAAALDALQDAGVEHLAELDGHMTAWRAAGLPVETMP